MKLIRFTLLFKKVDNSGIILWRILFGSLCTLEAWGAILTGWVQETFVEPTFRFTFIGFDFLSILSGKWMYLYFIILGIFGLMFTLGYKYKFSAISYFIMWACVYFGQKSHYNNHYYLVLLLMGLMIFIPANQKYSIDVFQKPKLKSNKIYYWTYFVLILQFAIMYFFATKAKLYEDWLHAIPLKLWLSSKTDFFIIGKFFIWKWTPFIFAYGGILYDASIIFLLLFRKTRKIGLVMSLLFHITNSIVFQIGIFPYLAISAIVLFWDPIIIKKYFFKKEYYNSKNTAEIDNLTTIKNKNFWISLFCIYFLIQIILPIRHHFFKGNSHWTEEGHRLSWQMMTRSKGGMIDFYIKSNQNSKHIKVNLDEYITDNQKSTMITRPDLIYQFAQYLKKIYTEKGYDGIEIYVNSIVSLNGKQGKPLINPNVNLANVSWQYFSHNDWIITYDE